MVKAIDQLAKKLIEQIYTTTTLKIVSESLEELSQNKSFKKHAISISTDPSLTKTQKKTQLNYLIRSIEIPIIYQFLLEEFGQQHFWLFSGGRIDYFDRFVQSFQVFTETIEVVHLKTAIPLNPPLIKKIATDLSDSFGLKVALNHEVSSHLTGGFKIKVENTIYDYSLHSKYRQFERNWIKTLIDTEKLVGRNIPDTNS